MSTLNGLMIARSFSDEHVHLRLFCLITHQTTSIRWAHTRSCFCLLFWVNKNMISLQTKTWHVLEPGSVKTVTQSIQNYRQWRINYYQIKSNKKSWSKQETFDKNKRVKDITQGHGRKKPWQKKERKYDRKTKKNEG